jgi:hypothetical protein
MQAPKFTAMVLATILVFLSLSSAHTGTSPSGKYVLTDDLSYANFFSAFNFFSGPDPTNGFVQYQNVSGAVSHNLVGHLADARSVLMGVDYTTKDPKGRASVRLESKKTWNHGLLVADIAHMPSSECGVWPAFWLLGEQEWPVGGEIDILEGVNDDDSNAVTLHTNKGCRIDNATSPASGSMGAVDAAFTGHLATSDCDVSAEDQDKNVGCSIHAPKSLTGAQSGSENTKKGKLASYGTPFNAAAGGIYAMEWQSSHISVWFFASASPMYTSLSSKSTSPDPATFGTPLAHFSGLGCDFAARFKDMRVIFGTTFCGEWAGTEWEKSCAKKTGVATCNVYVRDHPEKFEEAYWEVRGLRWYQQQGAEKKVGGGKRDVVPDSGSRPGSFMKAQGRHYRE